MYCFLAILCYTYLNSLAMVAGLIYNLFARVKKWLLLQVSIIRVHLIRPPRLGGFCRWFLQLPFLGLLIVNMTLSRTQTTLFMLRLMWLSIGFILPLPTKSGLLLYFHLFIKWGHIMSNSSYNPAEEFIIFPANHLQYRPQVCTGFDDLRFKCNHLMRAGVGVGSVLDGELNRHLWDGQRLQYQDNIGFGWAAASALLASGRYVCRRSWPAGVWLGLPFAGGRPHQVQPDGTSAAYTLTVADMSAFDWWVYEAI